MTRSRLTAAVGALALVFVAAAAAKSFPDLIPLPNGWRPEGIEAGRNTTLYVGSVGTGAVRQVDARSGKSFTLIQPVAGGSATGLEYDRDEDRLFVAGGGTGQANVYDADSGRLQQSYLLTPAAPRFINDAILTRDEVWFTDSTRPWLYRMPLGRHGALPSAAKIETLPLKGDYVHQPGFNLNGIEATKDGETLIAVQSNTASLFRIDPETGVADRIELTGGDAQNGDGLLLEGRTLYVVQNQLNRVAVVELAKDLGSGTVVKHLTRTELRVPTTVDRLAGRLYLPNARFGVPDPDNAEYEVVSLGRGDD
jgi:streptogramin lyase